MSRSSYLQEQLLYQHQQHHRRPVNIKRLRQQMLLEEQAAASAGNFVPVYPKFMYPTQQHDGLHDSLNSLNSDFTDYGYEGPFIVEQPPAAVATTATPAASNVVQNLNALGRFLELLQRWPLPRLSFHTACFCSLIIIFLAPRTCAQSLLFPAFRLFFGTLYPAYASYKAVRTKNVKEYVKWMMYWIVFAFFTCIETFTDIFLAWFPFYYEVKVVIVLWLLSPATKGSSTLYRKFVHPMLTRREQEIDEYLNQARERGYSAVLQLGSKGVNYATNVIMQTAIKGGGNLVQTIKRSYSLSDLSEPDMHRTQDELDEVMLSSTSSSSSVMMRAQPTRLLRQRHQTPVGRSASGTRHSTGMYFTEVDVTANTGPAVAAKHVGDFNYNIRSTDDISSGYSSAEPVSAPLGSGLSRTSSMTNASKARVKSKRSEQILEDMRAEVYLENERYFQQSRGPQSGSVRMPMRLKIDESEEENDIQDEMKHKEHEEEDEEEEDSFYEAILLVETPEAENKVLANVDLATKELEIDETMENVETVEETETETGENEECFHEVSSAAPVDDEINSGAFQVKSSETAPKTDDFKAFVDPFLLVMTESSLQMEQAAAADAAKRTSPVSPRELLATLEEIKHSFREQLEPGAVAAQRPKAQHSKGRAPAPPLPPRKESRAADNVSVSSITSAHSERTKSGIGQLFKSIKDNVLRKANQQTDEQFSGAEAGAAAAAAAKETSI